METVKRYWWVIAGVIVLLLISRRSAPAGPTVTQIGGGQDALALAQLQSQDALAADAQRYGFINSLLGYSLESDRLVRGDEIERLRIASNEVIAKRQAEAAEKSAQYGYNANQQALNAQNYQAQLMQQLQLQALQQQGRQQSTSNWLNAILGGFNIAAPFIFGSGGSGGGIFGGNGGGGSDWDDWTIGGGFGGGFDWGWL